MKKTVLITGGAGYIGSHAVKLFLEKGYNVIVFDNLSNGYKQCIKVLEKYNRDILKNNSELFFIKGDLRNRSDIKKAFAAANSATKKSSKHKNKTTLKSTKSPIHAVIHFAALCSVDESMSNPELYFENNTLGSFNLFEEMRNQNVRKIIFSSTCAVYGEINKPPVDEKHSLKPTNPYGESKLLTEKMLYWYGQTHNFQYSILRYFNVCGADKDGLIGDSKKPSSLLMQNAVRGALEIEEFHYTCPTVNTPDKTPIRDYIDVEDLVAAHLDALHYINKQGKNSVFNLGNGKGYSVKQIVHQVEKTLNKKIKEKKGKTRKGEYAKIYANPKAAFKKLNWKPQKDLKDSINSLVKWYRNYPNGYKQ